MPGFNIPGGGGAVIGAPSSLQETARRHRWRFEIQPYRGRGIASLSSSPWNAADIVIYAHKATRPSPEIDSVTIHHSQDEIYTPGKNRWNPIEISFYEVITTEGNITARYIYHWWSRDVIQIVRSRIAGKDSDVPLKRECYLTQLNGVGTPVYRYTLYGCWPEKVTPEDLNYDESAICEITVRLRYDKAAEEALIDAPLLEGVV